MGERSPVKEWPRLGHWLLAGAWVLGAVLGGPVVQARSPGQEINFNRADGSAARAWLFLPADPVQGTVVALHGCGGLYTPGGVATGQLTARHQGLADKMLQQGFAVVFPDSFTPRGLTEICTQRLGSRSLMPRDRVDDVTAARQWLAQQPWVQGNKVALLGWSHGGSTVLEVLNAAPRALSTSFVQAIAFYPGCGSAQRKAFHVPTPLLLLLGELDDWTPPGPCIEWGQAVGAQVEVLAGAYHDFDNPRPGVRLREDVPNGVHPGQGVHVGGNAQARERAYALVSRQLALAFQTSTAANQP